MKDQIPAQLPKGKTIVDVFADFMAYLFESTKTLFKASEPNGDLRWDSISNNIELILTHPNEWGGRQQAQMRTAAVKAGIVPDTPAGHSSVRFVTEGEASFNFCATHTQAGKDLKACHAITMQLVTHLTCSQPGEQVLIVDAGGGTIDISTYTVTNNKPLQVEELYEPECKLDTSWLICSVDNSRIRSAPRWRVRHCEGKSYGPRHVLIPFSWGGHSTNVQKS